MIRVRMRRHHRLRSRPLNRHHDPPPSAEAVSTPPNMLAGWLVGTLSRGQRGVEWLRDDGCASAGDAAVAGQQCWLQLLPMHCFTAAPGCLVTCRLLGLRCLCAARHAQQQQRSPPGSAVPVAGRCRSRCLLRVITAARRPRAAARGRSPRLSTASAADVATAAVVSLATLPPASPGLDASAWLCARGMRSACVRHRRISTAHAQSLVVAAAAGKAPRNCCCRHRLYACASGGAKSAVHGGQH